MAVSEFENFTGPSRSPGLHQMHLALGVLLWTSQVTQGLGVTIVKRQLDDTIRTDLLHVTQVEVGRETF